MARSITHLMLVGTVTATRADTSDALAPVTINVMSTL